MKKVAIFLCLILLLCNGCKYFKKSSSRIIDTISADTTPMDEGIVDSAVYYSEVSTETGVPSQAVSQPSATSGKYYMIVGCFTVQNNAEKYAEKIRGMGYEPQLISGVSNFQMVAARSYSNYRESIREIEKFRNEVTPDAWVYLKR